MIGSDKGYMRDPDAFTWFMERDPLLRSTVVSVVVLERAPDFETLRDRVERATRLLPAFREKIVETPLRLANPRWVTDDAFELGFHVRRIAAPAPGRLADVVEYACQNGMAAFDRERALWEFTLVEGLEDGRAAVVMKMHHSLTDGIGGMEMAKCLFDLEADPGELGPMPAVPVTPPASPHLIRDAASRGVSIGATFTRDVARSLPRVAVGLLRHPRATARHVIDLTASVARTVQPVNSTLSPVMQQRRLSWRYDTTSVPLDALRRAARTFDLTLNDAFLAAVSGGLLHYHDRHDASVEELRLTMPISIRRADDPIGGNRITLMRLKVPVGVRDPVARMRLIHESCAHARHEPANEHTSGIAAALNLLPRGTVGSMLKHVDFLASNVPGIDVPVFLAGAPVAEWYAFGPTIGAALNATLVSYAGRCYVGLNVDTGAVPDAAAMFECMQEGFDEVIRLG